MSTEPLRPIERLDTGHVPNLEPGGDSNTGFRRLLETLEALSTPAPGVEPATDDVHSFAKAIAKADDEFSTVMDMRRQLEEAFRSRLP